ncbi:MAG: N-acetylmuramoyl-L-alanine amidase [Acidimicrobiia bacterium]|nr:N-acetylmuramoyl-L-alanine amidase [Acidimicrobiia bacterium]
MGRRTAWATLIVLTALWVPAAGWASDVPPGGTFRDDDGTTHEATIEAIAAAGITFGCNPPANDRFCPGESVRRDQMATFLDRALDLPDTDFDFFDDDDGSIFETSINRVAAAGITLGCNPPANDRFCPDAAVRREVMAAFLVRAFAYASASDTDFTDTSGSPFAEDIAKLAAAGVTKGCNPPSNDRFCPRDVVTRGQMATFLARALDLDPIQPPPVVSPPVEGLGALPRSAWGAAPPIESRMSEHAIDTLTVHHAGDQSATTGPERYRVWQAWHQKRGWGDLAYHYIVGVDGTIYQARNTRYAGDTGTNYDPAGHFLVVLEGNFEIEQPTPAQLDSLVRILAWASQRFDVSPDTIGGHRDHAATACPGENLYTYIASGDLARDVRAHMKGVR